MKNLKVISVLFKLHVLLWLLTYLMGHISHRQETPATDKPCNVLCPMRKQKQKHTAESNPVHTIGQQATVKTVQMGACK